jgi:NADP-dependent 3-hydroxy acid dehydrogenase YdfG
MSGMVVSETKYSFTDMVIASHRCIATRRLGSTMGLDVNLQGRRVLVTGASSGIGAAICGSIVSCGGSVAMLARRKERLDQLHEELGERAHPVPGDVTNTATLEETIASASSALGGGLDGVVAVAGQTMVGTIATGTPDRWRELFDLNLMAPLATVRHGLTHFPSSGRRDVVVVSSAGALTPMANMGIYAASKRGLLAALDTLRLELAPTGVNVGCVLPGMFDTEAVTEGLAIDGEVVPNESVLFAPDGGPGSAQDVADAIAFMISRPPGFAINQLVVRPTSELNP